MARPTSLRSRSAVFRRITANLRRTFPEVIGHPTSLHGSIPHLALGDAVPDVPAPLQVHAREALLLTGEGTGRGDVRVR